MRIRRLKRNEVLRYRGDWQSCELGWDSVLEVQFYWFDGVYARFASTMYSNVLIAPIHILAHVFMSSETSFHFG